MIFKNGYIKVIDFVLVKKLLIKLIYYWTPYYMIPEVNLDEGDTFEINFWSIEIMIYEFIYRG